MGDKKAVRKNTDWNVHFGLFGDGKGFEEVIIQVLGVFGVEHDHSCVEEVGHLDRVGLNGQGRVNATRHKRANYW